MQLSTWGSLALGSRLKALSEALYEAADAVYRERDIAIEARWFPVLRLLQERGATSVTEIAREIGQTHSAVSQLAARLQRVGLVGRRRDPGDSRRALLALSAKGLNELRRAKPVWRGIGEEVDQDLAGAEHHLLQAVAAFEARLAQQPIAPRILERLRGHDRAALRVVPFSPALREHFYRLNADWLRQYFYLEAIDHRVLSEPEAEIITPGGEVLFALLGDEVVGTCALKRDTPGVFELTKMAVDPAHRGLGIGRALLDAAIATFKARGGKRLFLESNRKLEPALRLYESVGFEHQAALKPDSHYQRSDVYMIWRDPGTRGVPAKKAGPRIAKSRAAKPPAATTRTTIKPAKRKPQASPSRRTKRSDASV
jgi:ribosomal protein S18 acetylase RimI-like enzyme